MACSPLMTLENITSSAEELADCITETVLGIKSEDSIYIYSANFQVSGHPVNDLITPIRLCLIQ
jgi:hypothetical protein